MAQATKYDVSPAIGRKSPDVNAATAYDVNSARNSCVIDRLDHARGMADRINLVGGVVRPGLVEARKIGWSFLP